MFREIADSCHPFLYSLQKQGEACLVSLSFIVQKVQLVALWVGNDLALRLRSDVLSFGIGCMDVCSEVPSVAKPFQVCLLKPLCLRRHIFFFDAHKNVQTGFRSQDYRLIRSMLYRLSYMHFEFVFPRKKLAILSNDAKIDCLAR